MSDQEWVIGEL